MTERKHTIAEDLDFLLYDAPLNNEHEAALTRIRAALADREHLEESRFVLWLMLNPNSEHPLQPSNWRAANWLKEELAFQAAAERARLAGEGT